MEEALRLGADLFGGIPHYEHTRDLFLVDAPDKWDAIRRLATTTLVVKGGEIIAQTRPPRSRLRSEVVDFEGG
jgi:hypothetical protein